MGWILAIVIGGISGWLASKVMNRDASMGIIYNVLAGIAGSFIGNWVGGYLGFGGSIQTLSLSGFLTSLVGAIILLGVINLVQRNRLR